MQNFIIRFYYLLFIFLISLQLAARDVPFHLTCEYKENPAGIEVQHPRFGWWIHSKKMGMKQSAYEIVLASSLKNLHSNKAVISRSGRISSGENFSVSYNGPELQAASLYYWKVGTWDQRDKVSDWSKPASFITGLFEEKNWKSSKWISYDILPSSEKVVPAAHGSGDGLGEKLLKRTVVPYFRKTFQTKKAVDNAFVFVSGLGQYELYVNGKKIGNDFLAPAWSDYEKTIFYNTYDVTNEIRTGDNTIGSIAGPGR